MSDPNNTSIPAHPVGPTPGVKPVYPQRPPRPEKCETILHIGVFFDGTGNNMYEHEPRPAQGKKPEQLPKQSNVARLFRAYPDEPDQGYFRMYVPGAGTAFPEIGEVQELPSGSGFGAGGDGRINYGLLHVLNSINRAVSPNGRRYVEADTIRALCRNGRRAQSRSQGRNADRVPLADPADEAALRAVGMDSIGGLLLDASASAPQRTAFFKRAAAKVKQNISEIEKPKPIEIFIDVFGFSRGAAEARVFCNWLLEVFEGETLCGVPASIRFMGLFDTVASVGLPTSAGYGFNGHQSWGDAPFLRVSAAVKNCVHYVAMHENRGSFPSEQVHVEGVLPANCHEFMFPGMHSDVGGGYSPTDQGRGPGGKDGEKLSLLALEAMYGAAKVAMVPLDSALARKVSYNPFQIDKNVREAFGAFMGARQRSQPVREWLFEYLAWRYQVRTTYNSLPWHGRANAQDREDLHGANQRLLDDVAALAGLEQPEPDRFHSDAKTQKQRDAWRRRVAGLKKEAKTVYERVKSAQGTDPAAATLFADYVHDSYAGFRPFDQLKVWGWDPIPGSWEGEGYLRWRRRYEGNDEQLTRVEPTNTPVEQSRSEIA